MDARTQHIDDELTLKQLVRIFWRGKWVLVGFALVAALGAAVAAKVTPRKYQASVTISVVTDSSASGLSASGIASRLGGLASLAGISLGTDTRKSESLAILQSEVLTEQFIQAN